MRFSDLDGARIGVWGAGREIASFAAQLQRRLPSARIAVAAFDDRAPEQIEELLRSPGVRVVVGANTAREALADCELVVRSPGVRARREELVALRDAGVPVTTATALWLAERGGSRVLAITGTKGKSTTASLAHALLGAAGVPARLAGNIGAPALDLLDTPEEIAVVELSSYQIFDLEAGPETVLLTNLYREHVDWHGSEEAYRADKLRVLGLPGVRTAVLPATGPLAELEPSVATLRFGAEPGWRVEDGALVGEGHAPLELERLPLPGEHNALNLCAALTALQALGVPAPPLPEALADFRALPHRLDAFAEIEGVTWVDDSISTTPESTLAALASFPGRRVILLAGGQERGQDHGELGRALASRGQPVVAVPSTGARLLADARSAGLDAGLAVAAVDLAEAVARARALAHPGDVVLLSPAAPSYDHFRNFEQRGERFRELALAGTTVRGG